MVDGLWAMGCGWWVVGGVSVAVGGLRKSESKKRALNLMGGTGRVSGTRAAALLSDKGDWFY